MLRKLLWLEPYCSTPEVHKTSSKAGSGINILYLLTGPISQSQRYRSPTFLRSSCTANSDVINEVAWQWTVPRPPPSVGRGGPKLHEHVDALVAYSSLMHLIARLSYSSFYCIRTCWPAAAAAYWRQHDRLNHSRRHRRRLTSDISKWPTCYLSAVTTAQ